MSWITIACFFGLLTIKLAWDWYQKNKNHRVINHGKSAFYDICLYIPIVYFPNNYTDFVNVLLGILTLAIARGVFFDPLFNLINGWGFFNLGNSSKLDQIGDVIDGKDDNKGVLYFFVRLAMLLGMIYYFAFHV